ncbi:MAG: tetratricopeptide repeat protein [Betaproteobacteria bacterium]
MDTDPERASALDLLQLGTRHHKANRLAEAEQSYGQALQCAPGNADALHLLGVIAHQQGRPSDAIGLIDAALAARPAFPEAHGNRGRVLQALRRHAEALGSFDRALAQAPAVAEVLSDRGNSLRYLGRCEEAIASLGQALALRPDYAEAFNNLGVALHDLGRREEALAAYDRALALRADYAAALGNRGKSLMDLGRHEEALGSFERALALQPRYATVLCHRGSAFYHLRRYRKALGSFDAALAITPDDAHALSNRGSVLQELGRYAEALDSFARALDLAPGDAAAHWNRSLCRLVTGDYARGWQEYEWRWGNAALKSSIRHATLPLWLGEPSLAGKSIVLHAEQGLGDTLQFCRYAPLVAAQGARVILEVPVALKTVLAGLPGAARVVAHGEPLPVPGARPDFHCPLLSLPLAFRTTLETIPQEVPYLRADRRLVEVWRKRLGPRRGLRIGLAWLATNRTAYGRRRSIALPEFAQLIPEGSECFSLQKELDPGDREVLASRGDITHYGAGFADTAALIELMDGVISVDTSIAHLAGAMGAKVWVLLAFNPDWRWLLQRTDSPWYPTARLFRQSQPGNWAPVLGQVREELAGIGLARDAG